MFEHTSGCIWFILVEWFGQNPKWIQIVLKRDWKMVWEKEKRILLSPSFLLFGSHGLALLPTKARPSLACLLPHSPAAPRAPLLLPLWCVRWGLEGEGTHPFSRSFISSCLGFSPKKIFRWNQMIFYRDRVSCNGFGDCHDEIIVVGVDFIDRRPSGGHYPIICKGKGASGRLQWR